MQTDLESARLIDRLYSNHLTVWFTLFSIIGVNNIPEKEHLEIRVRGESINFRTMLAEHLPTTELQDTIVEMAKTSACRTYLRENFRITQNFCAETAKLELLQEQHWYQFARVLVNCLSHNMIFDLNSVNKNRLPAKFREFCIEETMHGKFLDDTFTAQMFLDLGDTILLFAAKFLTEE
jgi:hypothetical protein